MTWQPGKREHMQIKNGDFASALDTLSKRPAVRPAGSSVARSAPTMHAADASRAPGPTVAPGHASVDVASADTLTEHGLQAEPPAGASRLFAPQMETFTVAGTVLHGFLAGVVAQVPALADGFQIRMSIPGDDVVDADDVLPLLGHAHTGTPVPISAEHDLALELSDLLVRRRSAPGERDGCSPVVRALQMYCASVAELLHLAPGQVRPMHASLSDDVEDGSDGVIGYATVVVLGGQVIGIDRVCQAVRDAATTVQQHYVFLRDEAAM